MAQETALRGRATRAEGTTPRSLGGRKPLGVNAFAWADALPYRASERLFNSRGIPAGFGVYLRYRERDRR
jgi:hypothetical protein